MSIRLRIRLFCSGVWHVSFRQCASQSKEAHDVTLELGLIVGSETDVGLVLLENGVGAGRVEMLHIALLAVSGKVGDL
jgi:hypothetical protein